MTWAGQFRQQAAREPGMSMSKWIRQVHRWLAILFTLTVIANFAAMARGTPPAFITYSPLPPLFLLMFTGLYMFSLPYVAAWKARRRQA
jgi:cellulose synthase/poly-beta-1,6-N-acetylglucosamine synthase-like glycosyltransferase